MLFFYNTKQHIQTFFFLKGNNMKTITVKQTKFGEYVKRKADSNAVYIRKSYDKSTNKYELQDASDINRFIYLKGSTPVVVGFTY